MMWWWNDGWNGYWHGPWMVGPVFMIMVAIFCIAMMFMMARGMMGGHSRSHGDHALDLLKERFARGEITQAEYEERRRLLEA
jgi:putative membrane protein